MSGNGRMPGACQKSEYTIKATVIKSLWKVEVLVTEWHLTFCNPTDCSLTGYSPWACKESDMTEQLIPTQNCIYQRIIGFDGLKQNFFLI